MDGKDLLNKLPLLSLESAETSVLVPFLRVCLCSTSCLQSSLLSPSIGKQYAIFVRWWVSNRICADAGLFFIMLCSWAAWYPGTLTFFVGVGTCDGKSALESGCDAPNHLTRSARAVSS